jgi:hypothetical protein
VQIKLFGITIVGFDAIDQLLICCTPQILKKKWKYNRAVQQLFIDFKKAYDSVRRKYYTVFSLSFEYQGN